ncbi:MAG: AAA family ATPase [Candidatus Sulfotelmatobacter sp.]
MLFDSIRVTGFRSIEDTGTLPLGPVTLLVGRNNTGKSSLLRSVYSIQNGSTFQQSDIRLGRTQSVVELTFPKVPGIFRNNPSLAQLIHNGLDGPGTLTGTRDKGEALWTLRATLGKIVIALDGIASKEPANLIYPVLSGRRVTIYREQANDRNAHEVQHTDNNLVSRIMSLSGSRLPEGIRFRELCDRVLGIEVNIIPDENGQQLLGTQVNRYNSIPLEAMGAGLSGALSLIIGLSIAKNKLFVIEEPEDDLHPAALKALIDAIAQSSNDNQFLISTHSSIVLTRLSRLRDLKVLHVTNDNALPPSSSFAEVVDVADRIGVLQDLGYGLADLDLGEGWLIFEEASAERLIRQYLSPWFAPALTKLRTLAARGASRVEPLFEDFREMFLFAHLEPVYRNRAWVIVDGDETGKAVTASLRQSFTDWPTDHFRHWTRDNFELYYPAKFQSKVREILAISDRRRRQEEKKSLLNQVIDWIEEDETSARDALEESAAEVIALLREIEAELTSLSN